MLYEYNIHSSKLRTIIVITIFVFIIIIIIDLYFLFRQIFVSRHYQCQKVIAVYKKKNRLYYHRNECNIIIYFFTSIYFINKKEKKCFHYVDANSVLEIKVEILLSQC